jgi:starch synthase
VPPGDIARLGTALDDLLRDDAWRAAMGRAGREHALGNFGARPVARRYAAVYRAVAKSRRGA